MVALRARDILAAVADQVRQLRLAEILLLAHGSDRQPQLLALRRIIQSSLLFHFGRGPLY